MVEDMQSFLSGAAYLPTFEAGKKFLIQDANSQVQVAQSHLDRAIEYLAKIEALSEC